MTAPVTFRAASPLDAPALLEIYAPYVKNTAITFEYQVPETEEFAERITRTLERFPYILALREDRIAGYAYASPYRARAAYAWCAELSVYLAPSCRGMGIGKKLYSILENILKKQNILNLYACIAHTENEDEHLTDASVRFHEHLGFNTCGVLRKCGYKFENWYDIVLMEKVIGEHHGNPLPVLSFPDIKELLPDLLRG